MARYILGPTDLSVAIIEFNKDEKCVNFINKLTKETIFCLDYLEVDEWMELSKLFISFAIDIYVEANKQ